MQPLERKLSLGFVAGVLGLGLAVLSAALPAKAFALSALLCAALFLFTYRLVHREISRRNEAEQGLSRRSAGLAQSVQELKIQERAMLEANEALELRVEALKSHSRDILVLSRLVESLQLCRSRPELSQAVAKALADFSPSGYGGIYLYNEASGLMERGASWGGRSASRESFPPQACLGFRFQRPYVMRREGGGGACDHFEGALPGEVVCAPLAGVAGLLGHLELASPNPDPAFMPEERLRILQVMAEQCALCLGNLRLQEALKDESAHDALTGLLNRRQLDENLPRMMAQAGRDGSQLGLCMLDIDLFKGFNDRFGHKAGDLVLRKTAQKIAQSLRQGDMLFRYGGEEFVMLLPSSGEAEVLAAAEKVRSAVAALRLEYMGAPLGAVTLSAGAALSGGAGSPEELIRHADAALYEAKRSGRNRSRSFSALDRPEAA